jgi:hypothetical protein
MSDYACDREVCGAQIWTGVHAGEVRDGTFGYSRADTEVFRCGGCRVKDPDEAYSPSDNFYEAPTYRQLLRENLSRKRYYDDVAYGVVGTRFVYRCVTDKTLHLFEECKPSNQMSLSVSRFVVHNHV